MKITAHCFVYNVKIEPLPIQFKFHEYDLSITYSKHEDKEGLMLEVEKSITPDEISTDGEIQDEQGLFIEKRMRPYKEVLMEGAQLIEGFLAITYREAPPKFDTDRVVVNVIAENAEETELIKSGKVTGGFGNIMQPVRFPVYTWSQKIPPVIDKALDHIPAFSFLAQAVRSQERNDQEVAFFLYFRIVDGYFSDGVSEVEGALLKKSTELSKYIKYTTEVIEATESILSELGLKSKSRINFEGLISDIVLIRHKLTHFSESNAHRHHKTGIIYDLNILNFYLRKACVLVLWDKLGMK